MLTASSIDGTVCVSAGRSQIRPDTERAWFAIMGSAESSQIKVLVAEQLDLIRSSLRSLIDSEPDLDVVGEAGSGTELPSVIAETRPDVLVVSPGLPGRPLVKLLAEVMAAYPKLAIMVLADPSDEQPAIELLQLGAAGCALKSDRAEEFLHGVRVMSAGNTWVSSSVARSLLWQHAHPPQPAADELTEREEEILHLLTSGLSNKQIAQKLYLSVRTVEVHLGNIYSKLGVRSRLEAAMRTTRPSSGGRHDQE